MDRKQLSLFQEFICPQQAVRDDMSNTLMFWDALPKYQIPRESQRQLADSNGRLSIFRREVSFRDEIYTMEIYPAKIMRDGVELDVYPGETEELIEDVLRKFLADQNRGFFDSSTKTAHVYFTLDQVKKELKRRGKSRSYQEIVEGLDILGGSVLAIRKGKKAVTKDVILSITGVSRDEYLADPSSRWMATFHDFIMGSISKLDYRQMNYGLLMELKSPLTRYLYRRFCANYTYADYSKPYHFSYSSLCTTTEFFRSDRIRDHIRRIDAALGELEEKKLLMRIEKDEQRGKWNRIEEVVYTVYAHHRLKDEAVLANRNRSMRERALAAPSAPEQQPDPEQQGDVIPAA